MYTSEFLNRQPIADNVRARLEPIELRGDKPDDRSIIGAEPLLVDRVGSVVLRQLYDLDGEFITNHDDFAARMAVLNDFATAMNVVPYLPYEGPDGAMLVSSFVDGKSVTELLHAMHGNTKIPPISFIKQVNEMYEMLAEYYQQRIAERKPVLLDTYKSEQWVYGRTAPKSKPLIHYIDIDIHPVLGDEDGYNELEALQITRFVAVQAASVAGFLANTSKSDGVRNRTVFRPAIQSVVALLESMEADAVFETYRSILAGLRKLVIEIDESPVTDNEGMFAIGNIRAMLDSRLV